ncbi:hypothetical protein [Microvirga massiliensis]|uniref:hypothetical protein n=1 Tax=Microvirga massiliensis TaxID=1033741 RepID=UPI000A748368|nr:hypothetical protein [Microvirga massiliensis]
MRRFLSIALFTMISASPTLAQNAPNTTQGGGPEITIQSTKGTRTVRDTTVHTTLSDGTVVSTSKGTDGQPNGGAGSSGGNTQGGATGASYEGD